MGLIGKIALIGIVSIAVLIAVIWDLQNEKLPEDNQAATQEEIKNNIPDHIRTERTPNPETPQNQAPVAIEQPGEQQEPSGQPVQEVDDTEPVSPEEQVVPPAAEPGPNQPDTTGEDRKYIIQKKDTLYRIANNFYGDGKLWPVIAAANRDAIPDPEVLKAGTVIVTPAMEKDSPEKDLSVPPAMETYIIQKGDTLSSISRMHYSGDSSRAELIFQANKNTIKNRNILKPGTVIVIPALPAKSE